MSNKINYLNQESRKIYLVYAKLVINEVSLKSSLVFSMFFRFSLYLTFNFYKLHHLAMNLTKNKKFNGENIHFAYRSCDGASGIHVPMNHHNLPDRVTIQADNGLYIARCH